MAFKDLDELLDPLVLPIGGKQYLIPPVSMEDGLKLVSDDDLINLPIAEFRRIFLGTALDEMIADGVSAQAVARAAMTALSDYQAGRAVAEVMWETGGDPKALTEWQERQPTVDRLPESKRSRKPAAASTTKRAASTSTTTKSPRTS